MKERCDAHKRSLHLLVMIVIMLMLRNTCDLIDICVKDFYISAEQMNTCASYTQTTLGYTSQLQPVSDT